MKGTMVYAKLKKRAGFFNIFGSNKVSTGPADRFLSVGLRFVRLLNRPSLVGTFVREQLCVDSIVIIH